MGELVGPLATYRLQLNRDLTFEQAARVLPYLAELGVSHVYASPVLQARSGSVHGYDVVDHSRMNEELGGASGFEELARTAKGLGLGLILDIVPNHVCVATSANGWWTDVLENGPSSPHARHFDIDWSPPKAELRNRVLLPVLGDQYGRVLETEFEVKAADGGYCVVLGGHTSYPLSPHSWILIFEIALAQMRERHPEGDLAVSELESIITALEHLPKRTETDPERVRERLREIGVVRRRATELAQGPAAAEALEHALETVNGKRGDPRSFDLLERVLTDQAYRLSFWRVAADEINYRRFFDINELAAIRVEDPEVFEAVHAVPLGYVAQGLVSGFRIDHVDGLFDPSKYLRDLGAAYRQAAGHDGYIVVEKILGSGELLPDDWAIAGTTGYGFLNLVLGALVDRGSKDAFRRLATELHDGPQRHSEVFYQSKRAQLEGAMVSELTVLARRLDRISEQHRYTRDFTLNGLRDALARVIAAFPVYRTYVRPEDTEPSARDVHAVEAAIRFARRRSPGISRNVFDFIRDLLLLRHPEGLSEEHRAERREFVLKLQQLTGPVMAKGVEDTAFYRYFPLAALNEVGGAPEHFGVDLGELHAELEKRQQREPLGLSASATHDTKRGEDTRARMAVLSEMPGPWTRAVRRWRVQNRVHSTDVAGSSAPSADEEYLFYQTLVGAWPPGGVTKAPDFTERLQLYMEKALREAKLDTSWISPNEPYEEAVRSFIARVLDPVGNAPFLTDFARFHRNIEWAGYWNGLAQLLVKLTAPGVPDTYQGTELWDLSLVDPDNRRPVDFEARRRALAASRKQFEAKPTELVDRLRRRPADGKLKLWVLARALDCRRRLPDVFRAGKYVPLEARGRRAEQVIAYARMHDERTVLAVSGRFFTRLGPRVRRPFGEVWDETEIVLPEGLVGRRWIDAITGRALGEPSGTVLALRDVLGVLPVALLEEGR